MHRSKMANLNNLESSWLLINKKPAQGETCTGSIVNQETQIIP